MRAKRGEIAVMGYRLLVLIVILVGTLSVNAQTFAQRPSTDFRSTSVMVGTGSAYSANPTIGANGMVGAPITSIPKHPGQIRKTGEYDDNEEEDDEYSGNAGTPGSTVNEGDQLPIGDGLWVMMALLAVYCASRVYRRKRKEGI